MDKLCITKESGKERKKREGARSRVARNDAAPPRRPKVALAAAAVTLRKKDRRRGTHTRRHVVNDSSARSSLTPWA